jgi:CheY-like chemotaxis protein
LSSTHKAIRILVAEDNLVNRVSCSCPRHKSGSLNIFQTILRYAYEDVLGPLYSYGSSRQLKANNCLTELAVNGAEAVGLVTKARDEAFDCILMDCEMVCES